MTCPVLRPELPELPRRMRSLPVDARGYPVPWFVTWVDGQPEFRVVDRQKMNRAVREQLCWVCGQIMGVYKAFVLGPMCTINRVSGEPPSHRDCADFSARACPFLSRPHMRRRDTGLPAGATPLPGLAIMTNPGVTAVWVSLKYGLQQTPDGTLFRVGEPESVTWYAGGQPASRQQVLEAMERGMPSLRETAQAEGPESVAALDQAYMRACVYLPRE